MPQHAVNQREQRRVCDRSDPLNLLLVSQTKRMSLRKAPRSCHRGNDRVWMMRPRMFSFRRR